MQSHTVDAADLRITFEYRGDRWRHIISGAQGGQWTPVLTSHEGTPADFFPPSPAFQDLRLETAVGKAKGRIEDSPDIAAPIHMFQLLGQSGTNIYSAAVEVDPSKGTIDFDVCLRAKMAAAHLGPRSSYRLEPDCRFVAGPRGGTLAWDVAGDVACATVEVVDLPAARPAQCNPLSMEEGRGFCVGCFEPVIASEVPQRAESIRWRYRITRRVAGAMI